jgi:hypothetical protein
MRGWRAVGVLAACVAASARAHAQAPVPLADVTLHLTTEMRGEGAPRPATPVTVRVSGAYARIDGTDAALPAGMARMAGPGGYLLVDATNADDVVFTVVNVQKRDALRMRAAEMAGMGDGPAGPRATLDSVTVQSRLLQPPTQVAGERVRRVVVEESRRMSIRGPQGAVAIRIIMADTMAIGAVAAWPRGALAALGLLMRSTPMLAITPSSATVVRGMRPQGVPLQVASVVTLTIDGRAQRLQRRMQLTRVERAPVDGALLRVPEGVRVSDASVLFRGSRP